MRPMSESLSSALCSAASQPLMSPAPPDGCMPPWCTSTTMASMPCARSCGTSALTVSASSRNSRPATPVGVTMPGVPFSVMPMKAIGMPSNVLMP